MRVQAVIDIPDRKTAFVQLELAVAQARAAGKRLVVAYIHLDRFFQVLETKGVTLGLEVLREVGERLARAGVGTKTKASVVCQVGANDFLLGQEVSGGAEDYGLIAQSLKYAVESPLLLDNCEFRLTASIGASVYPNDGRTSDQLLTRAETALAKALEQGGREICFYQEEDTERIKRGVAIDEALRPALYERQFSLSVQPVYRIDNGKLRGIEALLRWQHPTLGAVSPLELLPIAERNGMIVPIGEWIIRESCAMLAKMQKYGSEQLIVTVNISVEQLKDASFAGMIASVVMETGVEPACLELEIKESTLQPVELPLKMLTQLRAQGVRIVLDDFGSGSCSLANLQQLPINGLKISRSFIRHIDMPGAERHIVEMLIGLAHRLGLEITASGVEYIMQYELLREWGCDFVQGYMLGMPMQPDVLDLSSLRGVNKA
ncbi:bifunctional diguanylate cyclase/phosphodiesterase [Paenibacillus sp. NEAU-GSW1]|uniref:putative bifunctional diguanylate cyclase/phosphodiesterase n=1 Tax=Paenibacillus sp. NEAU-GSW1 TaxID=2682486 RepID=UPI0012E0D7F3|nr:phosphodiesterase [Paenibacillus sp. NEAU-GSW1]MUT66063.1 EAL domain-containing protein [Paenibacillus sp. NEAU-GSW1]